MGLTNTAFNEKCVRVCVCVNGDVISGHKQGIYHVPFEFLSCTEIVGEHKLTQSKDVKV